MHNHHLVLKEKKTHPNWASYVKDIALTFELHMKPPPKASNANLTQNPTCLEYEVFIWYFGPHGSGHHPTLIDAFPSM